MNNYDANHYDRMAQRFVNPIYYKDEDESINFSSTMTFIKYENEFFLIFAAHALPNKNNYLENMGMLTTDGNFMSLSEITKGSEIYKEYDIVVCHTIDAIPLKNYFDLNHINLLINFNTYFFNWVGFPIKKAKKLYHKTKSSPEHLKESLSILDDGVHKWDNARFLILAAKFKSTNELNVEGEFENTNVNYKHEGFKEQGYGLKGMSGGAFYLESKIKETTTQNINDLYEFIGIGLEYRKNILVKGASRNIIIEILNDYLNKTKDNKTE